MLVEIWITGNGRYDFYEVEASYYTPKHYFVLKNRDEFDGLHDTLAECKEYTVDYDNLWGDNSFLFPKDES